jgi:(p)ppGpp synthase/HD superfamily hydrolase
MQLMLPPLRRTAADAEQVAAAIHNGGQDAASVPLMEHLARVATMIARLAEGCPFWADDHRDDAMQVAWLHHAISEGKASERDLRREGFSRIVIDDVVTLTRGETSSYDDWIQDMAQNADLTTVLVKLADVEDVLRNGCCAELAGFDQSGAGAIYERMKARLVEAAYRKGWEGDMEILSKTQ